MQGQGMQGGKYTSNFPKLPEEVKGSYLLTGCRAQGTSGEQGEKRSEQQASKTNTKMEGMKSSVSAATLDLLILNCSIGLLKKYIMQPSLTFTHTLFLRFVLRAERCF